MGEGLDPVTERELLTILPRLRRFATALTGSREQGDELLQATCERALSRIDQWQPGSRLDSWMYRIARNLHLNELRSRKARGEHLTLIEDRDAPREDGVAATESRLEFSQVRELVARLPEEQRTVLLLVCLEGLSYQETASILDLPVGTVTSRLGRARLALKECLGGEVPAIEPGRSKA
jgi:RNA polymerase sigma-70 factor (ECF subfamily)